jgi:hypothetical protein
MGKPAFFYSVHCSLGGIQASMTFVRIVNEECSPLVLIADHQANVRSQESTQAKRLIIIIIIIKQMNPNHQANEHPQLDCSQPFSP